MAEPLTLDALLAIFAKFGITLTVVVTAAWLLFRFLGDKWLSGKFDERLEAFRSAQQQEIERLKLRINTAFDWTVKLQGREFEVLAEIWEKLADAFHSILALTSPGQSYPDLDRMGLQDLNHFLSQLEIPEHKKDEIRTSPKKLDVYMKICFWQNYTIVEDKRLTFDRYLMMNRMFVNKDVRGRISALSDMMWQALNEKRFEEEHPDPRPNRWEKCERLRREGPGFFDEIGESIEARLWATAHV